MGQQSSRDEEVQRIFIPPPTPRSSTTRDNELWNNAMESAISRQDLKNMKKINEIQFGYVKKMDKIARKSNLEKSIELRKMLNFYQEQLYKTEHPDEMKTLKNIMEDIFRELSYINTANKERFSAMGRQRKFSSDERRPSQSKHLKSLMETIKIFGRPCPDNYSRQELVMLGKRYLKLTSSELSKYTSNEICELISELIYNMRINGSF